MPLLHGRAAAAAVYPRGLCRAIIRGIEVQRRREGQEPLGVARARAAGAGIYSLEEWADDDEVVVPEPDQTRVGDEAEMLLEFGDGDYWDENTGEQLPTKLAETSRREELEFMKKW